MENRRTIDEIVHGVEEEMRRLQYAPLTIDGFVRDARHLKAYIREKTGEGYFSEELGLAYLRDRIDFPISENRPLSAPEPCTFCLQLQTPFAQFHAGNTFLQADHRS